MRYSFKFRKKCVEMYKKGIYPETPDGLRTKRFRDKIRRWVLLVDHHGIDIEFNTSSIDLVDKFVEKFDDKY
ncbi:hypothetical protein [Streptobacillus canis]|uniref:hypothetical protein n=1 Tax=Streptobacillus canis TaxID=2678686 RepID=UPI0012E289A3|nr:hypothetical protein [Streptobacillus canis]